MMDQFFEHIFHFKLMPFSFPYGNPIFEILSSWKINTIFRLKMGYTFILCVCFYAYMEIFDKVISLPTMS